MKYAGKVGTDLTLEDGQKASVICALNGLSAIKGVIGDLNKIEQIIKVTVFVTVQMVLLINQKLQTVHLNFWEMYLVMQESTHAALLV